MAVDKKSFTCLLQHCKSTTQLKQIHAQIFCTGLPQDRGTLTKLMVAATDPSHGNLSYAERIFDCLHKPNLFIYNVLIKAFTKMGRFSESLFLFSRLRSGGLWPDNFTYPFVFKAIGYLRDVPEAEKLHGLVLKTGLEFDPFVVASLMDMYDHLGWIEVTKKLFDEMPKRELISWNVLISGYVKCRRFEEAIDVFGLMWRESSLRPDEATVVSILSACLALKNLELGKEIHCYVTKELGFTNIISNALLDMYCKCGCLSMAEEFFEQMPHKNVVCWTTMVSGYVNVGELDKARMSFEKSPVKDVVLWTVIINGYTQFNRFDDAVALFRNMQIQGVRPDKFSIVVLLTGCAQIGALEQGMWIHEYIDENKIWIDAFVGTALIEMYAKCGMIDKALEIFYELKEKDIAGWTSMICGLALNGKTTHALSLFSEMRLAGLKPDDITFICVLSACNHGGLVAEGRKFFNSMRSIYGIEPKLEHYGCLIDLLGRAGLLDEAEELIRNIPHTDDEIIIPAYVSLLSACRSYKNVEMAERVAKELAKFESIDFSIRTLLANVYASADRWEDVNKVRSKMKEFGVKKTPGCSSIEVDGIIHEFIVGDSSHPEMREIYSMLDKVYGFI